MNKLRSISTSALCFAACWSAAPVLAQSSEPAAAESQSADAGDGEIIVTAQRREQSIQDVPLAVSAISAETLVRQEATSTQSLLRLFPNVSGGQASGAGSNNYSIRGLSNPEVASTFDSPVATYIDGVYLARMNANNFALFDVERIEVLRGPQGTLFGRNTTNGAIGIILKKPSQDFGASVEAEIGNYDRYMIKGSIDLPLSPNIRTRFAAYKMDEDGYAKNITTGGSNNAHTGWGVRGAISADISDAVTWDLTADYIKDYNPYISTRIVDGKFQTRSGLTELGSLVVGRKGNVPGNFLGNYSFGITSNLKIESPLGDFEIITAYRDLSNEYNLDYFDNPAAIGGFVSVEYATHEQFSQELKLTGSLFDGKLDYTTGLYYFTESNASDYATVLRLGTGAPSIATDFIMYNYADAFAGYAQFDYHVSPQFTVTAGARLTIEDKRIHYEDNGNPLAGSVVSDAFLAAGGIALKQSVTLLTPRIAAQYKPSEDIMLFVSATRGFKSGGWNVRSGSLLGLRNFRPEKVWSYEGGIRSQFWDRRATINLTGFYAKTTDLQISTAVGTSGTGAPVFSTGNFSDFVSYGAELEANFRPTDRLSLFANAGYNGTKFTNPTANVQNQQAACLAAIAANITPRPNCGAGIVRLDGSIAHPLRAPEFTGTAGFSWEIPVGGTWQIVPSGNIRYVSEFNVNSAEVPNAADDGYVMLAGSLGLEQQDGKLRLSVGCENCNNARYLATVIAGFTWYNTPRRIYGRVTYKY